MKPTTLMVRDLPMDKALDRKAMAAVYGGNGMGVEPYANDGPELARAFGPGANTSWKDFRILDSVAISGDLLNGSPTQPRIGPLGGPADWWNDSGPGRSFIGPSRW